MVCISSSPFSAELPLTKGLTLIIEQHQNLVCGDLYRIQEEETSCVEKVFIS